MKKEKENDIGSLKKKRLDAFERTGPPLTLSWRSCSVAGI